LSSDKTLNVDFTDTGGTSPDKFPSAAFADETAAQNYHVGDTDSANLDLAQELNAAHGATDWKYQATVQNGYDAIASPLMLTPAYFMAAVGNRADFFYAVSSGTYPWKQSIFGASYDVPMATSVWAYMNGTQSTIQSDRYSTNLYGNGSTGFETVKQFGFNFTHGLSTNNLDTVEDALTTDQTFYRNGYNAVPGTGVADNTYYTLDSRVLSNAQAGTNTLAFRLNPLAQNYFDATGSDATIPYYRLSRVKLENTDQLNASNEFETLDPGHTIDVQAYVYAQQGSWFVIPLLFDDFGTDNDVRLDHVNLPPNSGTLQTNENLDLNRDGVVSRGEQAAVYRFHRYNYAINFTGSIMEKQTPIVKNSGSVTGAVSLWADDWATTHIDSANFSGGAFSNGSMTYGTNLNTIQYNFDATALNGSLSSDAGFHPPISPDLLYQSG
jgi:hypothetical protein